MNDILAVILQDTYSLTQLKSRLRILKSNLLKAFFGGETGGISTPQDLNWLKSLPPTFYQNFNKDNVYKIFTDIEAQIPKLPTLTMYLVFEPDDITLNQIGTAARKTFFPLLLLDVKLDPNLIAGISLVWKGIYKDYSLRARIEGRKEEILQGFQKFLR